MALLLKRRSDGAFWTGKVNTPEEWTTDPDQGLRFEESERYAINHGLITQWHTIKD